jgi:pilus assembly protein Flp/PilA
MPDAGVPTRRGPVVTSCFLKNELARFWRDESAATAIEYGLIAAGIALALIASVNRVGTNLKTTFTSLQTQLK